MKESQFVRASRYLTQKSVNGKPAKSYTCNLCSKLLNGNSNSNLVNHFKGQHKQIYSDEILKNKEEDIRVSRLKTVHSCVELVTINSLAFSVLSSSGFRSVLEEKLRAFQLDGCGLNLSDHNVYEIKEKIREAAAGIRDSIKSEVKGKIISVMIDSATRNGRSIFGINIQYRHNSSLKVVTLAMRELHSSHTAEYLTDVLINVFNEYGIDLAQVLSITSDNGSNMLAMVKDVENRLFGRDDDDEFSDDSSSDDFQIRNCENERTFVLDGINDVDDVQIDNEIESFLKEISEEDDALNILFDESSLYGELIEKLVIGVRQRTGNHHLFVSSIRCAAHSLQLAVRDAIKLLGNGDQNAISLCRSAAKFLRRQSSRNEMSRMGFSATLPVLDVVTRWSSSYKMVNEIIENAHVEIVYCIC